VGIQLSPDGQDLQFRNLADAKMAQVIARDAVRMALQEYREGQKRGRNDQGQGSLALGTILSKARARSELTQEDAAAEAGVHPTTIGKIETGDRGMSLQTFARLSFVYDDKFAEDVLDYYANV
jgi:DNA-binding XRE family transcriptional regulator